MRIVVAFIASVVLAVCGTLSAGAPAAGTFRVAISFSASRSAPPLDGRETRISMDQEVPPITPPKDTKQVKYLRVQNDRLTKFWGHPMHLGAIVLLPSGWDTHPDARYPIVIHHGHFPSSMEGDTWRETPPDA